MIITESLTRMRMQLLQESRDRFGVKNVWTQDGEIFTFYNKSKINVRDL